MITQTLKLYEIGYMDIHGDWVVLEECVDLFEAKEKHAQLKYTRSKKISDILILEVTRITNKEKVI